MDEEARTPSGLDPAHRREPKGRPPWGRRWPPRHPRPEGGANHDHPRLAYAALDLGTNNCRLLVARPAREGFRVIDAFSRIIRLGEGMAASGRLGEAAIGRAIEALSICYDKMQNRALTTPLALDRAVVLGDLKGYVHFLLPDSGEFLARTEIDDGAIVARPQQWAAMPPLLAQQSQSQSGRLCEELHR